ncbi:hypothetical protein NOF04DRAFT_1391507 [Fusarium oxysporum II5]|nr:hypothetical protein NOF04DRAFT_1391507 [Fusarium oxysporum II5]
MAPNEMSISLHLTLPVGSYEVTVTNPDGTRVFHNKIEFPAHVAPEPGNSTMQPTTSTPALFSLFTKLPSELRCEIWKRTLQNEVRVFYPIPYYEDCSFQQVSFSHKMPSVRQVCHESHQVSQTCGIFIFGSFKTIQKALWFGIFSDIIYDPENCPDDEWIFNPDDNYDYERVMGVARKVAVDCRRGIQAEDLLARVISSYNHCQTLFSVFSRYNEPSGDIASFTIPDNEILQPGIKKEYETWGEIKEEIMIAWSDEELLNELGITEANVPKIQAVGAQFVRQGLRG